MNKLQSRLQEMYKQDMTGVQISVSTVLEMPLRGVQWIREKSKGQASCKWFERRVRVSASPSQRNTEHSGICQE